MYFFTTTQLKGIDTLIEAVKYLLDEARLSKEELLVNIVGYGKLENPLRNKIQLLGLSEVVEIIIKPNNLNELYKEADMYICTSWYEGISNTIMEAMNACLPIIATNVGDNSLLVKEGENGFLFDVNDSKKLAEYIVKLKGEPGLRARFGERSYQFLKEKFSMEQFHKKYNNIIENLIDNHG